MMKASLFSAIALATLASAIPSLYGDDTILRRAVGDQCRAPLGTGSCQHTTKCPGISYPNNLCPHDPDDVQVRTNPIYSCQILPLTSLTQCCVNLSCDVPKVGSGYCRSVKNNGCTGGNFHAGVCPGDSDIKCCVKVASSSSPSSSPSPVPAPPNPCTAAALDKLLFQDSMSIFTAARNAGNPSCFDWNSDGCSCSPDEIGKFDFLPSCKRHDFGYRNMKNQNRFDEATRKRVDDNLHNDLYNLCDTFTGVLDNFECRRIADIYYNSVREFGGKKKRDNPTLQKRSCDLKGILSGIFWIRVFHVCLFMYPIKRKNFFVNVLGRAKFWFLDTISNFFFFFYIDQLTKDRQGWILLYCIVLYVHTRVVLTKYLIIFSKLRKIWGCKFGCFKLWNIQGVFKLVIGIYYIYIQ